MHIFTIHSHYVWVYIYAYVWYLNKKMTTGSFLPFHSTKELGMYWLFYGHLLYWARAEPRWVDCLLTPVSTGLRGKNWKKFLPEMMAKTISQDMNSVLTFHCSKQKLTSKQLSGWPQGYNPTWHTDSVGMSPAELTSTSSKVEKQRSNYCFPEVCWFPRYAR